MKKVYLIVSIMFLVSTGIILTACSSDDEIDDVFGGHFSTESYGNENEGKKLLETWELCEFDKGMSQWIKFKPNEVLCRFYANGIIEVINETDVNLSPLANSGSYPFQVYTKDVTRIGKVNGEWGEITFPKDYISIDGIEFSYSFYEKSKEPPLEFGFYHNAKTEESTLPNRYIGKEILMIDQNVDLDGPLYVFIKTK